MKACFIASEGNVPATVIVSPEETFYSQMSAHKEQDFYAFGHV
jgi:hypothetical protein